MDPQCCSSYSACMPFEELKPLYPIKNTKMKGKTWKAQDSMTCDPDIEHLEKVQTCTFDNWFYRKPCWEVLPFTLAVNQARSKLSDPHVQHKSLHLVVIRELERVTTGLWLHRVELCNASNIVCHLHAEGMNKCIQKSLSWEAVILKIHYSCMLWQQAPT